MPLSFQPACLPMAQSGMPHTSSSLALGTLMTTLPAILSWPRLPQRAFREQGFVQSAAGFPGLVVDTLAGRAYIDRTVAEQALDKISLAYLQKQEAVAKLNTDQASGLMELLRVPRDWFEGAAIKSQIVGPISLGVQMTDEQHRSIVYDPILLEALAQYMSLRVAWLSAQLKHLSENTIICLEEPFLDSFNSPFFPLDWERGLELLEIVFDGISGCRGIVVGGIGAWQREYRSVYWEPVLKTSVELMVFDAYYHSDTLLDGAEQLVSFLDRPGFIAWGLIPANEEALAVETTDTLEMRFYGLLRRLESAGALREQVLLASLITTSGNLDHLSQPAAERAIQLCSDVSLRIRLVYGLTEEK